MIKAVFTRKSLGRFNLLSNEKQWQLSLTVQELVEGQLIHRGLSIMFDEEDEPEVDNSCCPEEVLEAIKERQRDFLFRSDQTKDDEKAKWIEENLDDITAVWAERRYNALERQVKDLQKEMEGLQDYFQ